MKQVSTCDCPGKGKDVIIITIETCCKKSCRGLQEAKDDEALESGDSKSKQVLETESVETKQKLSSKTAVNDQRERSPLSKQPSTAPIDQKTIKEPASEVKIIGDDFSDDKSLRLPMMTERYHGKGCAMEISVLEKHNDNCRYKKDEIPGRNLQDDRVGSYDCIGRLVFRTCNPDLPDATHGGYLGTINNSYKSKAPLKSQEQTLQDLHRSISEAKKLSETLVAQKAAAAENQRRKSREEQLFMMSMPMMPRTGFRKHFSGDNCKLHIPRNPIMMYPKQFQKVAASKKVFPDEGNQTEPQRLTSIETIDTLSVSSKHQARKSSFLGSLFKKYAEKSSFSNQKKKSTEL